ncbi:MAG: hypothetical protein DRP37_02370 [Thermodesulfobacteriota bacterium]|nr:MAG: hypothetical protein DRP37_02370 [Thermodesulfobacteriota bacterium]
MLSSKMQKTSGRKLQIWYPWPESDRAQCHKSIKNPAAFISCQKFLILLLSEKIIRSKKLLTKYQTGHILQIIIETSLQLIKADFPLTSFLIWNLLRKNCVI